MGDEAQKRTTDCVYFLASPLTCKKGNDCEYRHSEAARINPRDCWYWLSGNCLNANCSFRHPPLDGRPGASATAPSAPSPITGGTSAATTAAATSGIASSSSTVPVAPSTSKSTVPCFFFSQGYCAKGGKCPFSHGPPTHFRKEATTYRKPQVSEQPAANGEGNGFSYVKHQSQDNRLASQLKPPGKVASFPQESGFTPSNVYKLAAPGGPMGSSVPSGKHPSVLAGEKADQNSHIGRSKLAHSANDSSTRQGQLVESRISQTHLGDECMQQITPGDKCGIKVQPLQLDLGRRIQKQGRQNSALYNARTSEELISIEMQDSMFETDAQHGARELHAGDLRNHLKRKKNDNVYVSQLKSFHGKERLESGRLASKAVAVVESKDFGPSNAKRAKEDKENFSGPKTLAQIKAEKTKVGAEDSLKPADCRSQGQQIIVPDLEVKSKVQLASEVHVNPLPESELKKAQVPISSTSKDFEGSSCKSSVLRPGGGTEVSNGILSHSLPLREVETAAFHSSENAEKHDGHKVDVTFIPMAHRNEGNQDLRSVGILNSGTHSYCNVDSLVVSGTETGYMSADDSMEDGTEALENTVDAVYASDYDEEDDFARKIGSFLS